MVPFVGYRHLDFDGDGGKEMHGAIELIKTYKKSLQNVKGKTTCVTSRQHKIIDKSCSIL